MKPWLNAISSGQAIFKPCRFSTMWMNCEASSSEIMGAGVKPGVAAAKSLDMKFVTLKVPLVEIGNLQLAARRRLHLAHDVDDAMVVEIETRHGIIRLWRLRLFQDPQWAMRAVELDHSVTFGVVDPARKHRCAAGPLRGVPQQRA